MATAPRPRCVRPRHGATPTVLAIAIGGALCAGLTGCRDVSRFSSRGDHFQGKIIGGEFVRAALSDQVELCLLLDSDHLQDAPGTISTSDGLFESTPLRPIPQIWHDPLSTLTFGEARVQSLVYMATPLSNLDAGLLATDVTVILSLMKSGDVEVRLLRSAPASPSTTITKPVGAAASAADLASAPLFGVFPLARKVGPCSF